MPTNRELFFEYKSLNNKYINDTVLKDALMRVNDFKDEVEYSLNFDNECKVATFFHKIMQMVMKGVPYQYVVREANFCSLKIGVNHDVLIPRMETEGLVYLFNEQVEKMSNLRVLDLCTGSGAIALAIKNFHPDYEVIGSDISDRAIRVAKDNAATLKLDVKFLESDLFTNVNGKFDVIISNPPYISDPSTVDPQVLEYEPHIALYADPKTYFYEQIFKKTNQYINPHGLLMFEIGEDMNDELEVLIKQYFPKCDYSFKKDIYNKFRYLIIKL